MDHPKPWLKYLKASDLHDKAIAFDTFAVQNVAGDHLGDVNGFIIDSTTGDPYYLVVDSRGWFKTKHFLVPIAQARLDASKGGIAVDLTRDQVRKFPGFDLDQFDRWSDEQYERFSRDTAAACDLEVVSATAEPADRWTAAPYHRRPDWWDPKFYRPERAGEAGMPPETWGREVMKSGEPVMAHDRDRRKI